MIVVPIPEGDFTQIPNAVIRCKYLTPGQKETWLMIASVCRHGKSSDDVKSWSDVAKANGVEYKKFMDAQKSLKKAGGLVTNEDGDWELSIPEGKEAAYHAERTIAEEVDAKPNVKTNTTADEAKQLIQDAWNKHKPESYMLADGKLHPSAFIAIESQRARLDIERPQVGLFVEQVCRGLTADTWWAKQTMKITSVFGFGTPRDKQYENVEKLYKLGAKVDRKIDLSCDADILSKYHEKGRTDLVRVVRLEAEDQFEAGKHLNEIPDAEFDTKAAYVYFRGDKIVHWSGRNTNSTRYLFA